MATTQSQLISGLDVIVDRYKALIVDAYGVLHDGAAAFPGAECALLNAMSIGCRIVIVTNSAQRVEVVRERLYQAGIEDNCYHGVISSGELAWATLREYSANTPVYIVRDGAGPKWLDSIPNPVVDNVQDAALIIAASLPWTDERTYLKGNACHLLEQAAARSLPMIVADVDEVFPWRGTMRLGPGRIARHFAELGGKLIELGKPHLQIYEQAYQLLETPMKSEILAIGDNMATDILGANNFGIDSLLVLAGGVHGNLQTDLSCSQIGSSPHQPTFIAPSLGNSAFS